MVTRKRSSKSNVPLDQMSKGFKIKPSLPEHSLCLHKYNSGLKSDNKNVEGTCRK